jgi:hypothetical protein
MRPPLDRARLDEAKRRVGISAAWRALGLPGEPRRVCCSPFREERHPSFSLSEDRLWHDHATGEGGDVVSFIRRAIGCEDGEAIKRTLALAGLEHGEPLPAPRLSPRPPAPPSVSKRDLLADLKPREPTVGELAKIQTARRWPFFAGLEIAARRGLLRVAEVRHRGATHPAWILTDNARKSAQARRLDGEAWPGEGHAFKSKSLRADAEHPPGLEDVTACNRRAVLICEGEPDTLAALTFAWIADAADRVGVLCLTGASKALPSPVLDRLQGRRVRICRQADTAGHRCALAWGETLAASGIACDLASVDGLKRPDGETAKDLADLLRDADPEALATISAQLTRNL